MLLIVGNNYKLEHGDHTLTGTYVGCETFNVRGQSLPNRIEDIAVEEHNCRKAFILDGQSQKIWDFEGEYYTWDKCIIRESE